MEKPKVVARSNLPIAVRAPLAALIYFLYSKIYGFHQLLDIGVSVLLLVWLVAEIIVFINQHPVDIFEAETKEE